MNKLVESFKADAAWSSLLCFAFLCGISMPLARIFLLLCTVCVARKAIRTKQWPHFSLPSKGWLAYYALAIIVSIIATCCMDDSLLNPSRGLGKLDKLIWFIGIPLVALLVNSRERFIQLLQWFVVGCVVAAVLVFITYTVEAWVMYAIPKTYHMENEKYREYVPLISQWLYHITNFLGIYDNIWEEIRKYFVNKPESFSAAFILQGTMQESQRLMAAIPAAFFLFVNACKQGQSRKQCVKQLIALLLIALALVFTCKRGPLIASAVVMLPLALYYYKRSTILVIVLLGAFLLSIPAARTRMLDLSSELTIEKGGRYAMWTQIVPKIHEEHPFGIGFMSLTTDKMRQLCPNMENRPHSHVHSTPLQVFVDFSWLGVVVYVLWIVLAFLPAIIFGRRGAGLYAVVPLAIITSLSLFGLVEYNLADAEVILLYSLGMGLCDCAYLNTKFNIKN